jgi:glutathione peroxidase
VKCVFTVLCLQFLAVCAVAAIPLAPRSFFELSARDLDGRKVHFSHFRGKVVLVVNTASECGFTPQLKELESVYRKYAARGFVVLAFPSNDFHQENQDNHGLLKFARMNYGVTFPIFDKDEVRGPDKQPVYRFLVDAMPGFLFKEVSWNFEKFLVNRQGQVIERWNSMSSPVSKNVVGEIEKALADPI